MNKLLAATALAASLAAPAFAQPTRPASPPASNPPAAGMPNSQTPTGQASSSKAPSNWITVASVENLVGRKLRDPQGRNAGEIHSVMVDVQSGTAVYAVVESDGDFSLDGKYIAVPFSSLTLARSGDLMNVAVPIDKLSKAKRFGEDQIDDMTKPQEVASLYTYYAVPQPAGASAPAGTGGNLLMVRRDTVMRMNAGRHVAGDVRGVTVNGQDGKELGEIDRIMVDTSTGRIAYLLLSQGGFLGMGENWVPVPAQALSWDGNANVFTLKAERANATQQAPLAKGDVPVQVRRTQLQSLYERFGVTPYWQG
ncbi:MAG: PRC-barrel domain containing protein [Proteobacteria bacterium]|nr:MAG: PRC-barrel domain containing protein [Pseudomonadota bacterium]